MRTRKITRRDFHRYLSHAAITAAFMRTLSEQRALGSGPQKSLVFLSFPNGHVSYDHSFAAIQHSKAASRSLFLQGLSSGCPTHSEGALLQMRPFNGGSFDHDMEATHGTRVLRIALGVPDAAPDGEILLRDGTGRRNFHGRIQRGFESVFGKANLTGFSGLGLASQARGQGLVDSSLEDVRSLRRELGSMGTLFDDHLAAILQLKKDVDALEASRLPKPEFMDVPMAETREPSMMPQSPKPPAPMPEAPKSPPNTNGHCKNTSPGELERAIEPSGPIRDEDISLFHELIFQTVACQAAPLIVFQLSWGHGAHHFVFKKRDGTPYATTGSYHDLVIHSGRRPDLEAFVDYHLGKSAQLADRFLDAGLLDTTALVTFTEYSNGESHISQDVPYIIWGEMGGTFKTGGRRVSVAGEIRNAVRAGCDGLVAGGCQIPGSSLQGLNS